MLSDKDLARQWGAKLVKSEGQSISVRIYTPPNCQVAKWNFKFDTVIKKGSGGKIFRYTHPDPFFVLFNPWCTGKVLLGHASTHTHARTYARTHIHSHASIPTPQTHTCTY